MTEHIYSFKHKPRGLALVIVNTKFDVKHLLLRRGAKKDLINMKTLFKSLDFKVKAYKDLTRDKMMEKLAKAAKTSHVQYDCFVCVISTHGMESLKPNSYREPTKEHVLYGKDGATIFTSDITQMFAYCQELVNKPKLFFIQACRSSEEYVKADEGHEVNVITESKTGTDPNQVSQGHGVHSDGPPTQGSTEACEDEDVSDDEWQESQLPVNWMEEEEEEERFCQETEQDAKGQKDTTDMGHPPCRVACYKDELIMWPVTSGISAPRNPTTGSWMLTYLHEELMKIQPNEPLLHALTRVSNKMAKESSKINVVSCISHRLCKEIYFTLEQKSLKTFM